MAEIAHQTDPDTVIVVLVVGRPATVGAPFLLFPAAARLDVPIGPALAVVDDEMVEFEFSRFVVLNDLDLDPTEMDDDDKRGFQKNMITKHHSVPICNHSY